MRYPPYVIVIPWLLAVSTTAVPTDRAMALQLAVAKKCLALTMQEYPRPRGYVVYRPGHTGTAKARQDYYRGCVAKELAGGEPKTE
jgi:hypothetical protein